MVLVAFAALAVSGCATTSGNENLTDAAVAQVKAGMTQAQVRALVGEPNSVTTSGNGEEIWAYVRMETETNAATFIPVVGLFAGGASSRMSSLTVAFGADGMVKTTSRNHTTSQVNY